MELSLHLLYLPLQVGVQEVCPSCTPIFFAQTLNIYETSLNSHCHRLHGSNHSLLLLGRPFQCMVDAAMPLSASDRVVLPRVWRTASTPCTAFRRPGRSFSLQPVSAQHRSPSCCTIDSATPCSGKDAAIH